MAAFENAITVDMAIGGSTNAIIHLVALAGRCGLEADLCRKFDEISQRTPVLANIRPSGEFLMEDFYYAGGLRALMAEIHDLLHLDCLTVNGKTLGENLDGAKLIKRRRDSPAGESPGRERRHRDSLWQPRARRSGDQNRRGRSAAAAAHRAGGGVQGLRTTWKRAWIARI